MLGSWVRGLGVVGGRVGNKICSMSTNGLSSDHVQAFSLLSSLRLRRKRFLPILSLPFSLSYFLVSLSLHPFPLFFSLFSSSPLDCVTSSFASRCTFSAILYKIYHLFITIYISHISNHGLLS